MNYWKPCAEYRRIVEANRCFYAKIAEIYDREETCVNDETCQRILMDDLVCIINMLKDPTDKLKVLDACGGSGNVALKLLERGINVTVVDISEDLLNILRSKCSELHYSPSVICEEIGAFLQVEREGFDLIVFSSALHHFQDIKSVLSMAYSSLKQDGLVFTIFDPTLQRNNSWIGRKVSRMDYLLFKIQNQPKDIFGAFRRKFLAGKRRGLKGLLRGSKYDNELDKDFGALAEFHAVSGIDDIELADFLRGVGYKVLWHERYASARFGVFAWLLRALGDKTHFKLLLRK